MSANAKRSLAATKANVTRKARKAALATATTGQLEHELLLRATNRAAVTILHAKIALENMEAKQVRRIKELGRLATAAGKGGAY